MSEKISTAEAAELAGTTEEGIHNLIGQGILRGEKRKDQWFVDKKFLKAWMKRRQEPRVQLPKIFEGVGRVFLENYRTIHSKEQAQHAGIRGTLYEQLLRDFLRDHLPQRFHVGSGQVLSSQGAMDSQGLFYNLSRQMDVVIFDSLNHPRLLPKYELFP